jgi:hypothetical protein
MPSLEPKKKELELDKTSMNELILFSIFSVLSENDICSFDRLVKECFTLFPKHFGFVRYPLWPDSRRLDRPLRSLRKEGFIKGDPKVEFFLTDEGKGKADAVRKSLRQGKLL